MKRIILTACASLFGLGLLFFVTDPSQVSSVLLVVPFALVGILLFSVIKLALHFFIASHDKARRIALLGTLIPTFLMGLQSVGQLTIRDFFTIALLVGLSCFYVSRLKRIKAV